MAESGDGHTLVSFDQLTHWTECPTWQGFKVNNFIEGMDLQANPCDYFVRGKVKASTLSLSVLVVIEMLNCLNAISEDLSLMTMPPHVNPILIGAIALSLSLHAMIVYVPFFNNIFSIYKLNNYEWGLVFAFSFPVILIDEVLKFFSRGSNERALARRLKEE
jgi:P-type Ca2+ transporter type 2C